MPPREKRPFTPRGSRRERKTAAPFASFAVRTEPGRKAHKGLSAKSHIERQPGSGSALAAWLVPSVVALLAFTAFLPALENGFLFWDDHLNFLENPHYRGLGWPQLRWMFTTFHQGHYQPLSWLTLGLDYLVWGMDPLGYHLTNLFLHAANAVAFYFVTLRLLRLANKNIADDSWAFQLSAGFATLVFAIHPLRVESVAWATERRDVLSGLFFLLTLLCYLRANAAANIGPARCRWMIAAFVLYGLSLLSKAIGVTLPIVLLLLDFYPLRRLGGGPGRWFGPAARRVWWEKAAFLIPAIAFGVIAVLAQHESKALTPFQQHSFHSRLAQTIFGVVFYLWKTILPLGLSPLYQLHSAPKLWHGSIILCGLIVLGITAGAVALRRRWPGVLAVWVYYLAVVTPVSGVAQSGLQIAADRYTYLACLGWAILAGSALLYVWRLGITGEIRQRTLILTNALALSGLIVLAALTWAQVGVWRDSETLWRHVLAIDPKANYAHSSLGNVLYERGALQDAIGHYRQALEIRPDALVHYNLGNALAKEGRFDEAKESYFNAVRLKPDLAEAHANLGKLFGTEGKFVEATQHYQAAIKSNPKDGSAHHGLALALTKQGRLSEAIPHFRHALEVSPQAVDIYLNFGTALANAGRLDEAAELFQQALAVNPGSADAYHNLGTVAAVKGDLKRAADYFRQALQIDPNRVNTLFNLANLSARQGQLQEAVDHYRRALRMQPEFADAHEGLARVLAVQGKTEEAAVHYREAVRILKSRRRTNAEDNRRSVDR
jgi:type IV pilus biogenesis/stability protein PilW